MLEDREVPATFTVTTTVDGGAGSLRAAINSANATAGADTIDFNISGGGAKTLTLSFALPTITDTVTIDGSTQPGYAGGPLISIDGSALSGTTSGLLFGAGSSGSTVDALRIVRFTYDVQLQSNNNTITRSYLNVGTTGVYINNSSGNTIGGSTALANVISSNSSNGLLISGSSATNNTVAGNYIGTDITGTGDYGNGGDGIRITANAYGNFIGGTVAASRNVISGNSGNGIGLVGQGLLGGNTVEGNYIGTNAAGTAAIRNNLAGILVDSSSANYIGAHLVGGTVVTTVAGLSTGDLGSGNVISGNNRGIAFTGTGTSANVVLNNYIGTNAAGSAAVANTVTGVSFISGASINNQIGGFLSSSRPVAMNVISGNGVSGVEINGVGMQTNTVAGNYIGVDATGTFAISNGSYGVNLTGGANLNTIGGASVGSTGQFGGNIISGNGIAGVLVNGTNSSSNTTGNKVNGNYIGLTADGSTVAKTVGGVAVQDYGVLVQNTANGNTIGGIIGTTNTIANVISGNTVSGVEITGAGTINNSVIGNLIGTTAGATVGVGNVYGVRVQASAKNNTIGGTAAGTANTIGGNTYGVYITGAGTTGNAVQGNYIGITSVYPGLPIGNTASGVWIENAPNNTIGGVVAGARNVISGNVGNGVTVSGTSTTNTLIQGNYIGTNVAGTGPVANGNAGVIILNGSKNNLIGGGTAAAANVISGNANAGVRLYGAGTTNNTVTGNFIGTNAPTNDQQVVAITGNPGSGTFTLTLNGQTTAAIQYNATAAQVAAAVQAALIPSNPAVIVTGTGGPLPNSPVTLSFGGSLSNQPVNLLTFTSVTGPLTGTVTRQRIGGQVNAPIANGNGLTIEAGAASNTVGGTVSGESNVISGNAKNGILLTDAGTTNNTIHGNLIGTDLIGNTAIANGGNGIQIQSGASTNIIGGTDFRAGNTISGNGSSGILLTGSTTQNTQIRGNYIGQAAPVNAVQTLSISGTATGGSFNLYFVTAAGSQFATINYNDDATTIAAKLSALTNIGANNVSVTGGPLPGTPVVITFQGALAATNVPLLAVGNSTLTAGSRAVVNNTVSGSQNIAVPNQYNGITIANGANGTAIGGNALTGDRNYIGGNIVAGVMITDSGTSNNAVQGNLIGSNASINDQQTINIFNSPTAGSFTLSVTFGATTTTTGSIDYNATAQQVASAVALAILANSGRPAGFSVNDVRGNGGPLPGSPVVLTFEGSLANTAINQLGIASNGLNNGGQVVVSHTNTGRAANGPLSNADGVVVLNGAKNNVIGGTQATLTNLISGNSRTGVTLGGAGTTGNLVRRNQIGVLQNGTTALGNGSHGVLITDNASGNSVGGLTSSTDFTIAGATAANIIANNGGNGVLVGSDPALGYVRLGGTGNAIAGGNLIYSNSRQAIDLGPNDGLNVPDSVGHVGPNNYQNSAPITSITVYPVVPPNPPYRGVSIGGTLTSTPGTYRMEFYWTPGIGDSGGRNYWAQEPSPGAGSAVIPLSYAQNITIPTGATSTTWTWDGVSDRPGLPVIAGPTRGDTVYVVVTNLATNNTSEYAFIVVP